MFEHNGRKEERKRKKEKNKEKEIQKKLLGGAHKVLNKNKLLCIIPEFLVCTSKPPIPLKVKPCILNSTETPKS